MAASSWTIALVPFLIAVSKYLIKVTHGRKVCVWLILSGYSLSWQIRHGIAVVAGQEAAGHLVSRVRKLRGKLILSLISCFNSTWDLSPWKSGSSFLS